MSKNDAMIHVPDTGGFEPIDNPGGGDGGPTPAARLHAVLRGRYPMAFGIGAAVALVFAIGGFFATKPVYRSVGMIHVTPVLPELIDPRRDNLAGQMYEAFVESQASLLRGQRIASAAVVSEGWKPFAKYPGDMDREISRFTRSLQSNHPPRTELIEVTFDDTDRDAAVAAVKASLEAYDRIYGDPTTGSDSSVLKLLEERKLALTNDLSSRTDKVNEIAARYATPQLDDLYQFKMQHVNRLESELKSLQYTIAIAKASPGATTQPGDATATRPSITVEEIAGSDPQMRDYLRQRNLLTAGYYEMQQKYGENNRNTKEARSQLSSINIVIERYAADFRAGLKAEGRELMAKNGSLSADDLEKVVAQEVQVHQLYDAAKAEANAIGASNVALQTLRTEADSIRAKLEETKKRIDQISMETRVSGRIQIISYGDRPTEAFKDRRALLGVMGATGGFTLGFGIIVILALLNPELRNIDDARTGISRVRMLGILPSLPQDLADPDQGAAAAYCVHHIRTMLQIGTNPGEPRALAITSPGPHDGKTTLTLALGMSYAAADSRTLLIDFDLTAGSLTSRLDAIIRRKIGMILVREKLATREQIGHALHVAQASGKRLGEVLVETGIVKQNDLDLALNIREKTPVGVLEVMAGEPLSECITETGIHNLWVLPVGSARGQHSATVSPGAMRRMIQEARKNFDVVLIDTGPVPACLETCHVAVEVDGVVFAVSRGEQRPLAERAVAQLAGLGAKICGIVFNRAANDDIQRTMQSYGSIDRRGEPNEVVPLDAEHFARFGPIASAVANTTLPPRSPQGRPGGDSKSTKKAS